MGIDNLAGRVRCRLYNLRLRMNQRYHSTFSERPHDDFLDEDWDNLFILDSCRPDALEELGYQVGRKRVSASHSKEFVEHELGVGTHYDTVLVTANPYSQLIEDGTYHSVFYRPMDDGEIPTVEPSEMADLLRDVHSRYPNKRLILHLMQPHAPFLGPTGDKLREKQSHSNVWLEVRRGNLTDMGAIWDAYLETLEIAMDTVLELHDEIGGRSAITADHGELFGERIGPCPVRAYEHPKGIVHPDLNTVPWFVLDAPRRNIVEEHPEMADLDESDIVEQLEKWGYR